MYLKMAADKGHANAQYNYGLFVSAGQGVDRNPDEALKYFKMAAAQGHASSKLLTSHLNH